jgi:branched-chain amino acid transport system substrate-binding protein
MTGDARDGRMTTVFRRAVSLAAAYLAWTAPATATEANIPVLVPLTGFLSMEGTSQRNGALLALAAPPAGVTVTYEVADTGSSPEVAVNALERALGDDKVTAVVASMLGTQLLAMLPVALEHKVPLITISGTAAVTRQNNPYVFRFFPGDEVTKAAQVRFAVTVRKVTKPAVIYQTTAYGQSGHAAILASLATYGLAPAYEEALDVAVKDMTPVLGKAKAAGADALLLQLHAGPTALLMKAASALHLGLPIIAGSGLAQPATLELLSPAELGGACAETGSAPTAADTPAMRGFLEAYRKAYGGDPDAFAAQQYDGTMMTLNAIAAGATSAAAVTTALASGSYDGVAMRYKSNGRGDMAHAAVIVCYDGKSRTPTIAMRYDETEPDR